MANVTAIDLIRQFNDEITVDVNGVGYMTQAAVARLVGVSKQALNWALDPVKLSGSKLGESFAATGIDPVKLSGMLPDIAITLLIEYYAFDAGRYCTEQAKLMARALMASTLRQLIQKVCGYQPNVAPNYSKRQLLEMALEAELKLEAAKQEIDSLVEQVTTLEPKAIAWQKLANKEGLILLKDFGGALGVGHTELSRKLANLGYFFKQGSRYRAYAKYIREGLFTERMYDVNESITSFQTLLTVKGAEVLTRKLQ